MIFIEDLTGKQFGKWTVLYKDVTKRKTRDIRWICKCECGTTKSVLCKYLLNGKSTSCGCARKQTLDGKKFGRLLVLKTIYNYNGYKHATYKCKCDCGNIIYVKSCCIYKQVSCGCSHEDARKDYTNQVFGNLTVKKMLYNYNGKQTYCECSCNCGNTFITRMNGLVTGNTTSCGCSHSPSLIGNKYGRLLVIDEIDSDTSQRLWLCKCDCGNTTTVHSNSLTSGHTQSCGCLRSESVSLYEVYIAELLNKYSIIYHKEYTFSNCIGIGGKKLRFDFFLPEYNTLIEYDGEQHFKPIKYFGGEESYNRLKKNDEIKNNYCSEKNITLIRIPYTYSKLDIEKIISSIQNPVTITVI